MTEWRNRIVERKRMRVGDLAVNRYNPKAHPRVQTERLRAVLDKFGIVGDLVAYPSERNAGNLTLFDGHARQGLDPDQEWEVCVTDLSDAEVDELVLYFDPIAAQARYEADKVAALMADLDVQERALQEMLEEQARELGFAFGGNGTEQEAPEAQIDKAAELQEKWGVATGDVWVIPSKTADGEHRVVCGDCTDRAVVDAAMMGERAGAVVTDPPYNVDKAIWDTNVLSILKSAADLLPSVVGDGIVFWFCATRYIPQTIQATSTLPYRWMFIWYPSNNMAHGDLGFQKFTAALVLSSGKIHRRDMQDLREVPIVVRDNPGHPTPKPIDLISYLVEKAVDRGGAVFDGFLGSGTTLVACERLGRLGRGIEIEPKYVAVTLQRLQDMGLEPRCLSE